MTCTVHVAGTCQEHDHDSAPCPYCGARRGTPCAIPASAYGPFCCPGCYHHPEGA